MIDRKLLLATTAFASALAAAATTPAFAQSTDTSKDTAKKSSEVEELVVTGSRIKRNEYNSSAPIQVITAETSTLQGLADTGDVLQKASVASGSFQVNGLLSAYVNDGGPGVSTISLRGLGSSRTLVLLNGRRVGPAGARGSVGPVDLNVIPDSAVERIEILKDGASSVYGSDAVAGVVNIITKTNRDGGDINIFGSLPQDSGGEQVRVSGSWGKTFDRGYLNIAGDYTKQYELKAGDRDYLKCKEDRVYDPQTGQRLDYIDPSTGKAKCWNVFTNVAQLTSGYGGVFQYAVPGITYPTAAQGNNIGAPNVFPNLAAAGWVRAGRATITPTMPYMNYNDPLYERASAISPYQRYTFTASGAFDLTPKIEAYGEFLFNRRESQQHGYQQLYPTVDGTNPTNPFVNASGQYDAIPIVTFKNDQSQTVDYWRAVGGLRGSVRTWDWDVYGEYSKSDATYSTDYLYQDRLFATTGPGVACDPTQITISGPVSCMTIPWFTQRFLSGKFTDAEKAFLFGRASGNTTYTQAMVEGTIQGTVYKLPAGDLKALFGASYRKEKIEDEPSAAETSGNMYNLTSAHPTKGDDAVKEVFAELDAPLLKGFRGVESLELQASGRYTDYDSYGSNSTYKVGLNWQIIPALRVRGTIGTSYRAPSLYQLYLGNQTGFLDQINIDPCIRWELSSNAKLQANCAAAGMPAGWVGGGAGAVITTGGGAGILKAETSKAKTIGVIWTPSFIDLSVAVDYFEIEVDNEIAQFGSFNILNQCYTSNQYPTDPFCKLFTRDNNATTNSHYVLTVNDSYVNVAKQKNRGIDLNLHYQKQFDFGKFQMDSQMTWQLEDSVQYLGQSIPENHNGSVGEPSFTGQVNLRFDRQDWTYFWSVEMYGKASDTNQRAFQYTDVHPSNRYGNNVPVYYKQHTEFTAYHNVSIRKKFDKWTVQAGIRNLFNEQPPALSGNETFTIGYSALNAYDFIGRRLFINIDRKF